MRIKGRSLKRSGRLFKDGIRILPHSRPAEFVVIISAEMARRYQLDIVQREDEIITFILVVDDPFDYFVEQRHEPTRPFFKAQTHHVKRADLIRYTVNDVPLIRLAEKKLEEISKWALALNHAA